MIVYSELLNKFLHKARVLARAILSEEMGLKVFQKRFLYNNTYYPLHLVAFEDEKKWGYFLSSRYQIGLNKALAFESEDDFLKDLLRHELAHYFCFLKFGENIKPHGQEFHQVCKGFGWNTSVAKASTPPAQHSQLKSKNVQKILKLLRLSESSNQHEAESALIKANQIMLREGFSTEQVQGEQESLYVREILVAPKNSAKLHALYDILSEFYVQPIFNYGKKCVYLEIMGQATHVEIAEYIGKFLELEMERLWVLAKKENSNLKGMRSKNSFFRGLADGFKAKKQKAFTKDLNQKALIHKKQILLPQIQKLYGGFSQMASSHQLDSQSYKSGHKTGNSLNLNPGIKSSSPHLKLIGP